MLIPQLNVHMHCIIPNAIILLAQLFKIQTKLFSNKIYCCHQLDMYCKSYFEIFNLIILTVNLVLFKTAH